MQTNSVSGKGKPIVPVVFSTDHNFVMPTWVAIKSMLCVSTDVICEIFILEAEDVTEEDRSHITKLTEEYGAKIAFISMSSLYDGVYEVRNISKATYFRLEIPWLIPQYDRVIYLDGDIIFKKSISNLWNAANDDTMLIHAVRAVSKSFIKYAKGLNVPPEEYINAGVLVFNSRLHRDLEINKQYNIEIGKKYLFQDQDIINIVCKGKKGVISNIYNLVPNVKYEGEDMLDNAVIIHYAGDKPWNRFVKGWIDWWNIYKDCPYFEPERIKKIECNTFDIETPSITLLKALIKKILHIK